jgi:hypothetical protein
VVLQPPAGSAIDTAVPARCTASEPELMLRGADACPEGSRVGGGELDLHAGAFISHDRVTLLNNEDELIFLTTPADAPVISVVTRARIQPDGSIVTTVPPVPGIPPPDPFTALDRVAVALDSVVDAAGHGYITTPPTCPPSGTWTWRASFTYRGGVTETAESTSPCTAPAPSAAAAEKCLPQRLQVGGRGIGDLRIGRRAAAGGRCVEGGGHVVTATRGGRVRLVATTARGHAIRGVHPGSSTRRLARAFPGTQRVGRGLRRDGSVVFGTRGAIVRFIAISGRREARSAGRLRRELRRAGMLR